jgi:hypothetical protein
MPDPLLPALCEKTELGDGVRVSFNGHQVVLSSDGMRIALEPDVYRALTRWVARYPALWEHFAVSPRRRPAPATRNN